MSYKTYRMDKDAINQVIVSGMRDKLSRTRIARNLNMKGVRTGLGGFWTTYNVTRYIGNNTAEINRLFADTAPPTDTTTNTNTTATADMSEFIGLVIKSGLNNDKKLAVLTALVN